MAYDPERITYFAETDFRGRKSAFGIKAKDRTKHVYVIGKTGMGKSTMLENMAVQDIRNGEGFAFLDPHGSTADKLLEYIPEERIKDVMYFAPFDMDHPISFNVMEDVGADKRHLVANGLMSAFKKIWVDAWSARMEYILNNTILALLEYPDSTLISINRMFADKHYRKAVVDNVTDTSVKAFWTEEFAGYTDRFAAEATPAIQNKVGQFVSNPLIRNIIGQPKSSFDIRKLMDDRKILIINLSKGRMGEDNANLLGSMLITKIYLAAMSRADLKQGELDTLPNFYFYVDEFQSFANESFANILSEARKYKLNLTIAHQYIEQMSDEVRAAVFGNVGTMISFRVGAYDADILEKEYAPEFLAEDIVNLGFAQIYLKLMVDGVSSAPFSATTLPPLPIPHESKLDEIIRHSREKFAEPREEVEEAIRAWHEEKYGGGGNQGGQSRRGKNKKGGSSNKGKRNKPPEEGENSLKEAISLATLKEGDAKKAKDKNKRSDKGPTEEKLSVLKEAIKEDKKEEDSKDKENKKEDKNEDGFSPLEAFKKKPDQKSTADKDTKDDSHDEEQELLKKKKAIVGEKKSQPEEKEDKGKNALTGLRGIIAGVVGDDGSSDDKDDRENEEGSKDSNKSSSEKSSVKEVSKETLEKLFNSDN